MDLYERMFVGVIVKIVAKPIEVIFWCDAKGLITPLRLRIVKVDKSYYKNKGKLAGNLMTVFTCKSLVGNVEKLFEIKYELATCKWLTMYSYKDIL
jgi:hypothetical protein